MTHPVSRKHQKLSSLNKKRFLLFYFFYYKSFGDINRGNTLDSHRLINYTGKQAPDKQHSLVEELCLGYFTQGKYIGDRYTT